MFFAHATYISPEFGTRRLAICSHKADMDCMADRADDGIKRIYLRYDKKGGIVPPIVDAIFKAAARETLPVTFFCNEVSYQLIRYTYIKDDERVYNPYRKNHIVRVERIARREDFFVYSERCRCTACYGEYGFDSIENLCGIVKLRENPQKSVQIDVQHCKHCGKYFIDQKSLMAYEERYGLLQIDKHHITGNEEWHEWNEGGLHPDSVLSRNGYSSTLPRTRRQMILAHIIRTGIAGKAEIKNLLIHFINFNGQQNPHRIPMWEEDLKFVNDFDLDQEEIVRFQ